MVFASKCLIEILLMIGGVELNPGPRQGVSGSLFSILSQNCRGLTDRNKLINLLRKIFPRSKPQGSYPIACLQEVHKIDKFVVENCLDGGIVLDNGERNQRGVCILVPRTFEIIHSVVSGVGRWAIATIRPKSQMSLHQVVVATVYAPNCHREAANFFQDFYNSLDEVTSDLLLSNETFDVVVCGDFNVVLDPALGSINRTSSRSEMELAQFVNESMLLRALHEPVTLNQQQCYTWRRGICLSKLDYVFVSKDLLPMVVSTKINWHEFGSKFDHAAVRVEFKSISEIVKGRGFPKLYQTDIRAEADKQWLAAQLSKCQEQFLNHWNPHQKLEFIKTMLRSKTLELRQMRKFEASSTAIKNKINELVRVAPVTREQMVEIERLKVQLNEAEEIEAEAYKAAAGVKWREEGEKSTAYFLGRFKARAAATMMYSINTGTRLVTGSKDLVSVVKQFYSNLYSSQEPSKLDDSNYCDQFFANCPTLDLEQRRILSKPLDLTELRLALARIRPRD